MGSGLVSYADALGTKRDKFLTRLDQGVLFPGHGEMTTADAEKMRNPFFPD